MSDQQSKDQDLEERNKGNFWDNEPKREELLTEAQLEALIDSFVIMDPPKGMAQWAGKADKSILSFHYNLRGMLISVDKEDDYRVTNTWAPVEFKPDADMMALIGKRMYGNAMPNLSDYYSLRLVNLIDDKKHHLYLNYEKISGGKYIANMPLHLVDKLASRINDHITKMIEKDNPEGRQRAAEEAAVDKALEPVYSSDSIVRIIPALKSVRYVDDDACVLKLHGQLDAKDYATLKKIFADIGGKWNRKDGTHVFEESPMDHINQIIETGVYKKKYNLGYFPTPEALVQARIEDIRYFPGMRMLEPEMGQAHIADKVKEAFPDIHISGFELNPKNHAIASAKHECKLGDFLEQEPTGDYDLVFMNPPFEKQQDIIHVQHAMKFLKPGGQMIAIMSGSVAFREDKRSNEFRELVQSMGGQILENPAGSFKESGTNVHTISALMINTPQPKPVRKM